METAALTAPTDDRELVASAREGDADASEELARRLRGPAFRLAYQLLRDREDALDVAQEALLRFFGSLHSLDASRPPQPWLYAIVRNRARDLLRRRKTRTGSGQVAWPAGELPAVADAADDPESAAARRQLQQLVWECIGELSTAHREILVLREYQDLSYAEIARLLDIPAGTVMSRLHAARSQLRARVSARRTSEGTTDA